MNGEAAERARAFSSFAPAQVSAVAALLGLGLLLWFSLDTIRMLNPTWLTAVDYSHGHLVLLMTAWLLVVELRREPLARLVPSWPGVVCFFALVLATLAGRAATTLWGTAATFPALWIAAVWAAAGC